ncbi:MAG: right-handed parallel beta-helix repeat-containing protein, partial [Planctomycetota bacterium]|nr:right-handed parallel beta-helix repeat-containing protein [Planctomycetota bacterium]
IAKNTAANGGGIGCTATSNPRVKNSIIWENNAGTSGAQIYLTSGCSAILNYCCYDSSGIGGSGSVLPDAYCLTNNPLFVDATNRDYHLKKNSPCINAGNDSYISGVTTDLDGRKRIWGTSVDIGCYEGSWLLVPSGYGTIQAAIDAASDGDVVLIADGVYTGIGNRNLDFKGKKIHLRSRSLIPESCVINCETLERGVNFTNGETEETILEGFTIMQGRGGVEGGGGILCKNNSSPIIRNCVIVKNSAVVSYGNGGGIRCLSGASPRIINCIIKDNVAQVSGTDGAGIHCSGSGTNPVIINCIIANNLGQYTNSVGAGIFCGGGSSVTIIGCLIADNATDFRTGGIHCNNANVGVANCTIAYNRSANRCGGVYVEGGGTVSIRNSILWGNNATGGDTYGHQVYIASGSVTMINCDYSNGTDDIYGSPILKSCITSNPLFVDGSSLTNNNYRLRKSSPCINAGDNSYVPSSVTTDLDGRRRIWGTNVDIGCYEGGWLLVPGNYSTIQAAIDAASDGDGVLVSDGTYTGSGNKQLNLKGKNIWLRSANGAGACIIDCENLSRGFYLLKGESPEAVIEGFTVKNGAGGDGGGGIYCVASNPTFINCFIRDCVLNPGNQPGAGVYLMSSSPVFINCAIVYNSNTQWGGGVYCSYSNPVFINCTIAYNSAGTGGGIGVYGGSKPVLKNTILWGNISTAGNGNQIWTNTAEDRVWLYTCDYASNSLNSNNIKGNGIVTADSNCITEIPQFVSPTGRDFRLQSTSPCKDIADSTYLLMGPGRVGVTYDAGNYKRFHNYKLDIGAYEYQP